VHGILTPHEGVIDFPIRRSSANPVKQVAVKEKTSNNNIHTALTRFTVIQYLKDAHGNDYTLVEAKPETGRMHQIRVHFAAIGHNIVGDKIYKDGKTQEIIPLKNHFLHATSISFTSPTGKILNFSSPLPKELDNFLKTLIPFQP
jgi:23S rRNA-/tRNA-specific pseudouridylate synthase